MKRRPRGVRSLGPVLAPGLLATAGPMRAADPHGR
jgi:hypothetical protein